VQRIGAPMKFAVPPYVMVGRPRRKNDAFHGQQYSRCQRNRPNACVDSGTEPWSRNSVHLRTTGWSAVMGTPVQGAVRMTHMRRGRRQKIACEYVQNLFRSAAAGNARTEQLRGELEWNRAEVMSRERRSRSLVVERFGCRNYLPRRLAAFVYTDGWSSWT
jgi:hypothetical protein